MAAPNSPWSQVERALRDLPWFMERHLVARKSSLTASEALEVTRDFSFLLDWMVRCRLTTAPAPDGVSLWEVVALSPTDMARYQSVLAGAVRYRNRKDALRHLRVLQEFLTDTAHFVATDQPTLLDRRQADAANAATLLPCDEALLVLTAAAPDSDLFPLLSDNQVVAGPLLSDTYDAHGRLLTATTPKGIWELSTLLERLPPAFRAATVLVQCDGALMHRPRGLDAASGARLLVGEGTDLAPLPNSELARYVDEESFDGVVSVGTMTHRQLEREIRHRQIPGLLSRLECSGLGRHSKPVTAVVLPGRDGDMTRGGAEIAEALAECGLSSELVQGSMKTCFSKVSSTLVAVHLARRPASFISLLGSGSLPLVAGSEEVAAFDFEPAVAELIQPRPVGADLAAAVRAALKNTDGTRRGVRLAMEAWHRHCRLAETRRRLWGFVTSLRESGPGDIARPKIVVPAASAAPALSRLQLEPEGQIHNRVGDRFPASRLDPSWLGDEPPAGGRVLKLYIDSTSLSVIHQMADFVVCEHDPNVFKLITWRRCVLDPVELEQSQTRFNLQGARVSPEFVSEAVNLVEDLAPDIVEIHSNQRWSLHGVLPVLRPLFSSGRLRPEQVTLRLYDDGLWSLLERDVLARHPALGPNLEQGALGLARLLYSGSAQPIQSWMTHGWHRVLRTRYVGIHLDRFFRQVDCSLFPLERYAKAYEAMRFQYASDLAAEHWRRYLALYGLDEDLERNLLAFQAEPDAFLYLGTGSVDPVLNARYAQLQVTSIPHFQRLGLLPRGRMGFKGHPANSSNEREVIAALGGDVLHVPARIPLEVLEMAGLLPTQVGGVVSTSYLTLPAPRTRFVFGRPLNQPNQAFQDTARLLVECGVLRAEQVFPWFESKPA